MTVSGNTHFTVTKNTYVVHVHDYVYKHVNVYMFIICIKAIGSVSNVYTVYTS